MSKSMRLDRDGPLDVLDAIVAIERHQPTHQPEFDTDELVRVWCLRHIQIIGVSAANVSQETRALAGEIPWGQIVGMRNALVPAYFNVDWPAVWNVVSRDLPPQKFAVERLLYRLDTDQHEG